VQRRVHTYRDHSPKAITARRQSGRPPNLPSYGSGLNPAKRLWAYLHSHYLSNRACADHDDLLNRCGAAWNQLPPSNSIRCAALSGYGL
jgi:transposase